MSKRLYSSTSKDTCCFLVTDVFWRKRQKTLTGSFHFHAVSDIPPIGFVYRISDCSSAWYCCLYVCMALQSCPLFILLNEEAHQGSGLYSVLLLFLIFSLLAPLSTFYSDLNFIILNTQGFKTKQLFYRHRIHRVKSVVSLQT